MDKTLKLARSELILGGQRSGKSRRAELLAREWLAMSPVHHSVLIATARSGDDEMRARIARHRIDRSQRVPGMRTVEEPLKLAEAIQRHSGADTLVVVDCLTLWLTNWLMPAGAETRRFGEPNQTSELANNAQTAMLLEAISGAYGPIVLVSNEIGLGVIPMGAEVRDFVDTLGRLNQGVAQVCQRVTLMAAGLPLTLKSLSGQGGT
ncbi:MAG TPA: bifunctional adenosylcobinamide kinase/adenosylcobinamide-phosphate guanylyltransferase [Burkholderiaceae bacterium]|nr:bifunctional adenosylcobinamide kinase/adenosylcobinamide-phosphate guanylyltransferase [Burkholderiaceae bacterium]